LKTIGRDPFEIPDGPSGNLAVKYATEFVDAEDEFRAAKARFEAAQGNLRAVVSREREASIRKGWPIDNRLEIPTVKGDTVLVIFQDRFRSLPKHETKALLEAFRHHYDDLVYADNRIKFRTGTTYEEVVDRIGQVAAAKLEDILLERDSLLVASNAAEQAQILFAEGETEIAEDLLELIRLTASQPQIRKKKKTESKEDEE